jgi:hypothetical protein
MITTPSENTRVQAKDAKDTKVFHNLKAKKKWKAPKIVFGAFAYFDGFRIKPASKR